MQRLHAPSMRTPMLAALLAAVVIPGFAQDLSRCASVNDDAERLLCYDTISGRSAGLAPFGREPAAIHAKQARSIWEQRIYDDAIREPFELTAYQPNYVMYTRLSSFNYAPYRFIDPQDRLSKEEIKLRLSLQVKMLDDLIRNNGDLWFGYTQTAYWQLLNDPISSPFRETNHEPEVHIAFLTDYSLLGLRGRGLNFGLMHQSNGQTDPLSRSWNRVFAELQFVRGNLGLSVKPWLRIAESSGKDDNPDIERYFGNYELRFSYERGDHLFSLMLRNVLDSERRYGAELSWSFPIAGRLRGLVQWYNGYGENLIDYNHKNSRIGVGVLLSDWL